MDLMQDLSTPALLLRKQELVSLVTRLALRLSVSIDYPGAMMREARIRDVAPADRIELLEALLELESIKYALAARRLREVLGDEANA